MSVEITKSAQSYTWENNFTWDSFPDQWQDAAFTAFDLDAAEKIFLDDKAIKKAFVDFQETAQLKDFFNIKTNLVSKEKLLIDDTFARTIIFNIALAETIKILSSCIKQPIIQKEEAFGIKDFNNKAIGKVHIQDINVIEELRRKSEVYRNFVEKLGIKSQYYNTYKLAKLESIGVYDAILEACRAVLSNISIRDGEMSLDDFKTALKTAPGFTEFIDFKVGEYEYQEALIRLIIDATVAQTQPSVSDVVMHVDIPDTDDRGIAEITDVSAPTKVYFNKHYYKPPEVAVTLRGGNTGNGYVVPHLITTEGEDEKGRYFEVELLNSTNQRVTGLISWISKGY